MPAMNITNQKPVEISPVYQDKIKNTWNPVDIIKEMIADKLFTPQIANVPVTITQNNQNIDAALITQRIMECCGNQQNSAAEIWVKNILGKSLIYFNPNTSLNILSLFQNQAATKNNMPLPSPTIVYTPMTDIIPTAKGFLAGQNDIDQFFVSLAFVTRIQTLGYYFTNSIAFDTFKAWLKQELTLISTSLSQETNQAFADFDKLSLSGLTESLILRNDDSDNNEPMSFARVLVAYLIKYANQNQSMAGVLPFDLGELICPKTLVFVNIEQHAHASSKQIKDEWDIIKKALQMKIHIISNNKLKHLTATIRAQQKIQASIAIYQATADKAARAANIKFRQKRPTTKNILYMVKRILQKMHTTNMSQNSYKCMKMTYQKPNRRDPDDFNKKGKSVSTKYYPDLHFYIDTSGSISEENYEDAIKACIALARKLNINVYFNSFSHCMSSCTCLKTQNKSVKQIYAEFQKVPKVTGGTNFEQIWHYINNNKKRQRELSIIITDFEWTAPNYFIKHPENLYYAPCSHMDWERMKTYILDFAESMLINDPNIAKHILI